MSEGKFSFPVIAAIHAAPSNPLLISILRQKPRDDGLKRCALRYMEEVGAFKYTQRRIEELRVRCLILVSEMEQNLHQDGHRKCDAVRLILESYFITWALVFPPPSIVDSNSISISSHHFFFLSPIVHLEWVVEFAKIGLKTICKTFFCLKSLQIVYTMKRLAKYLSNLQRGECTRRQTIIYHAGLSYLGESTWNSSFYVSCYARSKGFDEV